MKDNPLVPVARSVRRPHVKLAAHLVLVDAIEAYYEARLANGYSTKEAATVTVAFVRSVLSNRLP